MRSHSEHAAVATAIDDGPAPALIRWAHQWPVTKKMAPGQPGTKRWAAQHGDELLCVRYRQDLQRGESIVTVAREVDRAALRRRQHDTDEVAVGIGWQEIALRIQAREAGARFKLQTAHCAHCATFRLVAQYRPLTAPRAAGEPDAAAVQQLAG